MSEEEQVAYRRECVKVVYAVWHFLRRSTSQYEIYYGVYIRKNNVKELLIRGVKQRVQAAIDKCIWPYAQFVRSKRTVDRRVNEAAAKDFYEDGMPQIVRVDSQGNYQPNPALVK